MLNPFQSTLPARGATLVACYTDIERELFQSTLPARGATSCGIHSPANHTFQSTLPARGATRCFLCLEIGSRFQSTLPARGATRWTTLSISPRRRFQSTLPARGATLRRLAVASCPAKFQSTLPARGATRTEINHIGLTCISIHAPRTGSDLAGSGHDQFLTDFNPRSPHGERPAALRPHSLPPSISIHAPRTGSDKLKWTALKGLIISIHAPRTGSDRSYSGACALRTNFNPRSPHGERPARTSQQPN